jgi:WD40 repeat protein
MLAGHRDALCGAAVLPGGQRAVSVSLDNALRVWDLATGQPVARFTAAHPLLCCATTADGRTLIAGDRQGAVYFLRLDGDTLTAPDHIRESSG